MEESAAANLNLQERQSLFKVTVEQMHEGMQIIDFQWRYLYLNDAAAAHGMRSKEKLLGSKMMDIYPGIEKTEMFQVLESVMQNREPRQIENHFQYPDGKKCWFDLFIEPHISGILIRSIDITKRKMLENHFQSSQKLEAIGLLAAGVAHDFNNKLGIMSIYCEMALAQLSEDSKIKKYLQSILTAVRDSSILTQQLLAFGRKQVLQLRIIDINEFLANSKNNYAHILGQKVELHFNLSSDLGYIQADMSQLDQVILNLCLNAKDAIKESGCITIETSNVTLDNSFCEEHTSVIPGEYILLSINDNGAGMTAEIKEHIFDPFYTTKESKRSSGLGLSSVHGIVNQSRGHIIVESEPNKGSTFKIFFPRVYDKKEPMSLIDRVENKDLLNETLLLAEDDQLLRESFQETLEAVGYRVIACANAIEAQEKFNKSKDHVHLLMTDVQLPGMSGLELSRRLRALTPNLKVIFISGYSSDSMPSHDILDADAICLQKPITTHKLISTIRQALKDELLKGVV